MADACQFCSIKAIKPWNHLHMCTVVMWTKVVVEYIFPWGSVDSSGKETAVDRQTVMRCPSRCRSRWTWVLRPFGVHLLKVTLPTTVEFQKHNKQSLQWESNFQPNCPHNFHCIAAHIEIEIFGPFQVKSVTSKKKLAQMTVKRLNSWFSCDFMAIKHHHKFPLNTTHHFLTPEMDTARSL